MKKLFCCKRSKMTLWRYQWTGKSFHTIEWIVPEISSFSFIKYHYTLDEKGNQKKLPPLTLIKICFMGIIKVISSSPRSISLKCFYLFFISSNGVKMGELISEIFHGLVIVSTAHVTVENYVQLVTLTQ